VVTTETTVRMEELNVQQAWITKSVRTMVCQLGMFRVTLVIVVVWIALLERIVRLDLVLPGRVICLVRMEVHLLWTIFLLVVSVFVQLMLTHSRGLLGRIVKLLLRVSPQITEPTSNPALTEVLPKEQSETASASAPTVTMVITVKSHQHAPQVSTVSNA